MPSSPTQVARTLPAKRADRWVDAFPWLEAAAADAAPAEASDPWWRDKIDQRGTDRRRQRLDVITKLVLERLDRWTIGQIFPGLPRDTALDELPLPTRIRNLLARDFYITAADLRAVAPANLRKVPQLGADTMTCIVRALADVAAQAAVPESPSTAPHERAARGALPTSDAAAPIPMPRVVERPESISGWYVTRDTAEVLEHAIGAFDVRTQRILAERLFADRPQALAKLAHSLGVSAERVRQIDVKARDRLAAIVSPCVPLRSVSMATRELIGAVLPMDDLLRLIPALGEPVESVRQPAWRVFERLGEGYEIAGGWCASPTLKAAREATRARLAGLVDHHGVVRLSDIGELNPHIEPERQRESLIAWLQRCGHVVMGDHVLTRTRPVHDYAAAVLSIVGSPMSPEDLVERLDATRSAGSLDRALRFDGRFERIDFRGRWALAEWRMKSRRRVRALVR